MRAAPASTGFQDTYPNPSEATFAAALVALLNTTKDLGESPELDLASAATCDVGGQSGSRLRITGSTGITSLGTNYRGVVLLRFAGACAITHNATTLICPAGLSFTTTAGDLIYACPKATAGVSDGWVLLPQNGASSRLAVGADVSRRVQGLTGANNSGTPTTQFDISADSVTLRDSAGAAVVRQVTGTLTCNFSTAGPAINARDQAGAFSASSFVNLFFIWNGSTLASIASTASPTTGPALPSGYTHWAFATTVRWNASSNILPCYAQGNTLHYQAEQFALAGGAATTETTVTLTGLVPTTARRILLNCATTSSINNTSFLKLVTGVIFNRQDCLANTTVQANPSMPNTALIYVMSSASGNLTINVLGFVVANGDA